MGVGYYAPEQRLPAAGGASRSSSLGPSTYSYSPECVEYEFSEVRMATIYTQRRTLAL